jgi:hypothetical protein
MGDITAPLPPIGNSDKKRNTEILELNDSIGLMELIDVYRVLHSATAQCTFFSAAQGAFSKIDHILGHKSQQI